MYLFWFSHTQPFCRRWWQLSWIQCFQFLRKTNCTISSFLCPKSAPNENAKYLKIVDILQFEEEKRACWNSSSCGRRRFVKICIWKIYWLLAMFQTAQTWLLFTVLQYRALVHYTPVKAVSPCHIRVEHSWGVRVLSA